MTTHAFEEMIFAGFKLPRAENGPTIYNPTLTDLPFRFENWKGDDKSRGNIGRVTYPNNMRTADTARTFRGWGTYLEDDRILGLRWAWCDEIPSDWGMSHRQLIGHRGWFLDDDIQDDVSRGIVLKLPRGRGYLAGWSLGEGMITEIDCTVFEDAVDAARAADSMAENMAEKEREYRAACCEECGEHEDDCDCGERDAAYRDADQVKGE